MRRFYVFLLLGFSILILLMGEKIFFKRINLATNNVDELEGDITFVSNRTDKREEIQLLINEFENLHPKVHVELELIGDAETILKRKTSVGELPDVTLVPSNISKSEYANYFIPIDDLGFDDNNIYNYGMGLGNDDRLYCLNTSITWQGIIYNKNVFKDADIEKIPTTIEELFQVCDKIKNLGVIPMAMNYRQPWTMNLWVDIIPDLFESNLSREIILGNKTILNKESGMYKSLNLAREIVKRGYCEEDLLNYDWQQFKNDMNEGKIAMVIWNSDFINQLEDMGMNKEDIGMFPIPETNVIKIYGDYKFAVSKNSDNKEVAKEFLKYIFEESRYSKAVKNISPLKYESDSKDNFETMKEYGIPIEFYDDFISNQSVDDIKVEEEYLRLKNINELNASFVQKYITEDDINTLINVIENKWRESTEIK